MSNIATTIEQSKHLLELGLDPATADMFRRNNGDLKLRWELITDNTECLAWSLYALLEVMRKLNATITLQISDSSTFLRIKDNGFKWQKDIHVKNPMDAVYGGILWLFEQGLIKKGDNDDSTTM